MQIPKHKKQLLFIETLVVLIILCVLACSKKDQYADDRFVTYVVDSKEQQLKFFLKDENGNTFKSIRNLRLWVEGRHEKLLFAMNAGMYQVNNEPQGLYIENGQTVKPLDTLSGEGNFYLKPNGIFYITNDNTPVVCTSTDFREKNSVKYATQSGPMLLINGKVHPAFKIGSPNLNIRNGVGILDGSQIIFAMSKRPISFYDMAEYFKKVGCKNALYLDGFVSRTYLPEKKWIQEDGDFGVIIGVVKKMN